MNRLPRAWHAFIALLLTATTSARPAEHGGPANPDDAPLPKGAVARLGSLQFRTGPHLYGGAFSADGKVFATGSGIGGAVLWDLASGKEVRRFRNGGPTVAFARDGQWIVSGGHVWETQTGAKVCDFPYSGGAVVVSPDNSHLALVQAGTRDLRLVDSATGKLVDQLQVGEADAFCLGFSPDGRWLVSTDFKAQLVNIWDVKARIRKSAFKQFVCRSVAFANASKHLVTASADGKLRIHQLPGGELVRVLADQKEEVWRVIATADGSRIAATLKDGIRVWDAASLKELRHWESGRAFQPLAFSPDGRILATMDWGEAMPRFWDVATGQELWPSKGHRGPVEALAFSADGNTLRSISTDRTARAWNWRTGDETKLVSLGPDFANHLTIAFDRKTAAVAWHSYSKGQYRIWDLPVGKQIDAVDAPPPLRTQVFSPDGRLLAWQGWQGTIHVWDIAAKKERHKWTISGQQTQGPTFTADGKAVAFGEPLEDDRLNGSTVCIKDLETGKEIRRVPLPGRIDSIRFSPDGRVWATATFNGSSCQVRLWDANIWREELFVGSFDGCVRPCFSPDGKLLALPNAHRSLFPVLEVVTGKEIRKYDGHLAFAFAGVQSAAFSPDGRVLATGGGDSTILVWDLTGHLKGGALPEIEVGPADLAARWADLADADATRAFDSIWALAASPRQAVPFLAKQMKPAIAPPELPQLIRDLDDDDFDTRDRARRRLIKLGEAADPALRQALNEKPSLEAKRRIEKLLDQPRLPLPPGDLLRGVRAVQVLEAIGNADARRLLQTLAGGAEGTRLTVDAQGALGRLSRGGSGQ